MELERRIIELHDKYHPEVIFVTQTSGILKGYSLKEAWKKTWPNEKPPKFLTLNIRPVSHSISGREIPEGTPEYRAAQNILAGNIDYNNRGIQNYEEMINSETNSWNSQLDKLKKERESVVQKRKSIKNHLPELQWELKHKSKSIRSKIKSIEKNKKIAIEQLEGQINSCKQSNERNKALYSKPTFNSELYNHMIFDTNSREFNATKGYIKNIVKRLGVQGNIAIIDENAGYLKNRNTPVYEPEMGASYRRNSLTLSASRAVTLDALRELGLNGKVAVMGLDTEGRNTGDSGGPFTREGVSEETNISKEVRYRRYSGKEERETAKKNIQRFKEQGRYLAKSLSEELEEERRKSLEQKVLSIIGLSGVCASLFFLSLNITGNAIGNLSKNSNNFIGIFLLIIGLTCGFFWMKNRRR